MVSAMNQGKKGSVNSKEEGALLGQEDQERKLSVYGYQQRKGATYTKKLDSI